MKPTMELRWVKGDPSEEFCIMGTDKYAIGRVSGEQDPNTLTSFKLQQKWIETGLYTEQHEWRNVSLFSG